MRRSSSWPLLSVSDGDDPPVLLRLDSDLDIACLDDEDDMSNMDITDTQDSVGSKSSVRFNISQQGQSMDGSILQRKRSIFVTQRNGVYYSLDGEEDALLPASVQGNVFSQHGRDVKKYLERQCSTATKWLGCPLLFQCFGLYGKPYPSPMFCKHDQQRYIWQGQVKKGLYLAEIRGPCCSHILCPLELPGYIYCVLQSMNIPSVGGNSIISGWLYCYV